MLPATISHAVTFAAGFLGGFEDDEQQEGVAEALKELRRLPMICKRSGSPVGLKIPGHEVFEL